MADNSSNKSDKYCPVYKDLGLYREMSGIPRMEKTETRISRMIMLSLYSGDDLVPIVKRSHYARYRAHYPWPGRAYKRLPAAFPGMCKLSKSI